MPLATSLMPTANKNPSLPWCKHAIPLWRHICISFACSTGSSSISFPIWVFSRHKKSVEPVLLPVSSIKAFALPWLSKRATLKAPRWCNIIHPLSFKQKMFETNEGHILYIPWGVLVALCFWQSIWSCEVLMESKPKRQITPLCISAYPHLKPNKGFLF